MPKNYHKEITEIIKSGILQEDKLTIQKKMIELSKIHDVNAMKTLYLLIRMQPTIAFENTKYLMANLDYQDKIDHSTIMTNLANNTVKASYRLLYALITSFYINPNLKDENKSTLYGYLMAHLADIYKADNNFHAKVELEKLMFGLVEKTMLLYPFDPKKKCYQDKFGSQKNYYELLERYQNEHSYYFSHPSKETPKMKKLLKRMEQEEPYTPSKSCMSKIRDIEIFQTDERFTKVKRYNYSTLEFTKKHF